MKFAFLTFKLFGSSPFTLQTKYLLSSTVFLLNPSYNAMEIIIILPLIAYRGKFSLFVCS